ncbi:MAG: transposase [Thermotogae bacterium]|nr:transposase [Thermotogota bacterium]
MFRKTGHTHSEKICQTAGGAPNQGHEGGKTPFKTAFGEGAPLDGRSQPRYTSQHCPRCGSTNQNNRHGHLFHCSSCGFVGSCRYNCRR